MKILQIKIMNYELMSNGIIGLVYLGDQGLNELQCSLMSPHEHNVGTM